MMMKNSLCILLVLFALAIAGCDRMGNNASRSDSDIATDVQAKINTDSAITNKGVAVNATNGTVTLNGTVANETERMAAANDAAAVGGVKTVVNNLTVGGPAATMPMATNEPPPSSYSRSSNRPRATTTRGTGRTTLPSNAGSFGGSTPSSASSMGATSTPAAPVIQTVTVPSGTALVVYLNEGVSSETANEGDHFSGTL